MSKDKKAGELVRVRFLVDCIHSHLPMKAGEDILVEPHWADSIERIGSGVRVVDSSPPAKGKE